MNNKIVILTSNTLDDPLMALLSSWEVLYSSFMTPEHLLATGPYNLIIVKTNGEDEQWKALPAIAEAWPKSVLLVVGSASLEASALEAGADAFSSLEATEGQFRRVFKMCGGI